MKDYSFTPQGVCAKQVLIRIDEDVVRELRFVGGCPGNAIGVSSLVKGMKMSEVIERLKGIDCGGKGTSCPDQLCRALEAIQAQ
nr:TIGR03905 family TSCPD domain-containing protein [uncultured Holophaga sp.]